MKKILFIILSLAMFMPILALANTTMPQLKNPTNSINFPNLTFGKGIISGTPGNYTISTPWVGNYVESFYNWAMGLILLLSVLTIAIGGVIWVTAAGNQGKIKEAKSWIGSSILGLSLAMSSYLILTTINPDLGGVSWITVNNIEPQDPSSYNYKTVATYKNGYNNSIYGNKSGAPGKPFKLSGKFPVPANKSFANLINFYMTKVTIHYVDAKNDPNWQQKRGRIYNGKAYSDCSDFAARLASYAGLNKIDGEGTTTGLFLYGHNNRKKVTDVNTLEGLLNVGDVVGYNDGYEGHVMTYIGNGQLIECGGDSGDSVIRQHGAIKIDNLRKRLSGYTTKTLYYINR